MHTFSSRRAHKGFTLAELLIALAILGVIATFTIPKILSAQTSSQATAIAKEAASMFNAAFTTYSMNNTLSTGTTAGVLTQYMNYVAVDTTTAYTGSGGTALSTCSAALPCLKLHNGGILQYSTAQSFSATTGGIEFEVDPDGNGTIGGIEFIQFYNGRLSTVGANGGHPTTSASVFANINTDPSYLTNWN